MSTDNDKEINHQFCVNDVNYNSMLADLSRSETLDDLTQRIQQQIQTLGFTDFLFCRLERSWQISKQKGLLMSFPASWLTHYTHECLYDVDLMMIYSKNNTTPIFSSELYRYIDAAPFALPLKQSNQRVTQLNQQYGYLEHYIIPMPACNTHGHVMLALTSTHISEQELQEKALSVNVLCQALCRAIDGVTTEHFASEFILQGDHPTQLTRRQWEVLNSLINEDRTIKGIATLLSISPVTAHQHLAAIRKQFHTNSNVRAVIKAIKSGLIPLH